MVHVSLKTTPATGPVIDHGLTFEAVLNTIKNKRSQPVLRLLQSGFQFEPEEVSQLIEACQGSSAPELLRV